jgi:outer membrane PBP1 activator LpoA protein
MITTSEQMYTLPQKIALLLPFNSKYNDASNAIREGFMAAWYATENDKPIIQIYNADAQNILNAYQLAVDDGVEFIVGPLEKTAVKTLINNGELPVRTMVLNHYDSDPELTDDIKQSSVFPGLIQFGLSPEDEARQVAERAWFDGNANALIITPGNPWGERILNAFSAHWRQLGGRILEHIALQQDSQDYSTPAKQILNIDNSEQRAKLLKSKLNRKIFNEPRRRMDADFIFIATIPNAGRQLVPQLRFYRADDLKFYSISNIYSGTLNPQADSDINNVIFADMPWIVDPSHEYSLLQRTLDRNSNQSESAYRRLYALGIDAYRLIPHLGRLSMEKTEHYEGETGNLKLDKNGRILRQLLWVKFVNGEPRLIDTENTH